MKNIAVIMAGGSGERFWPLSRQAHPKQLLCLGNSGKTMLAEAIDRIRAQVDAADIYVQTMPHLLAPIRAADLGIPKENVIAEPCKRNTAGCLCYAAAHTLAKYNSDGSDLVLAILTADHRIGDQAGFQRTVATALATAANEAALVTIGVPPDHPATGFGYIQAAPSEGDATTSEELPTVHRVKRFQEKPDRATAASYLAAGNYFWNSGMFFWRLDQFRAAFSLADPAFATAITQMKAAMQAGDDALVTQIFEGLKSISIDYALMEKAEHVLMVRATFPWEDVGSWAALDRARRPDAQGNVVEGDPVLVNTRNAIVCNHGKDMAVGVVGVENVVLVVTDDAVLLVSKDHTEDVKQVVEELKRRNSPQL